MSAINEVEDEEKEIYQQILEEPKYLEEISSTKIKLLYILTVATVLLIVVLVYIIVIFVGGNSKNNDDNIENNNKTNNETFPDFDPFINSSLEIIYVTSIDGEEIQIFNENFTDKISSIIIDNTNINITHIFQFNESGEHNVIIEFNKTLESTEEMFKGCDKLKGIILNDFKTEYVKSMASMFCGCSSLISLNLSSLNTKRVTNMSYLFNDCSLLNNIILDNLDTSNVIDMKYMFSGCKTISSLNLKNFNTKKLKEIKCHKYEIISIFYIKKKD